MIQHVKVFFIWIMKQYKKLIKIFRKKQRAVSLTSTAFNLFNSSWSCKISHPQVFVKKNYSENQKMKNLSWSPLSIRLQACGLQLYEQRIPTKVLPCEICEIFQNGVSSDYLWTAHLHFLWPHIWETLRVKFFLVCIFLYLDRIRRFVE